MLTLMPSVQTRDSVIANLANVCAMLDMKVQRANELRVHLSLVQTILPRVLQTCHLLSVIRSQVFHHLLVITQQPMQSLVVTLHRLVLFLLVLDMVSVKVSQPWRRPMVMINTSCGIRIARWDVFVIQGRFFFTPLCIYHLFNRKVPTDSNTLKFFANFD
jgi:hypothetical protein